MTDLRRREVLKVAGATGAAGVAGGARALGGDEDPPVAQPERSDPQPYEEYDVHRVNGDGSADFETVGAAVEAAEPRDLVLVEPGVYTEAVKVVDTPRLTIRGTDRHEVVFDGENKRRNAIAAVGANGVVMENMTARNYQYNGFFWTDVDGYRGTRLTAINNGDYGIYAFSSVNGRFEKSYTHGHPDSGFYIGQCSPCHAIIDNVIAERNALGYSGTNAGGYLTVKRSLWQHNMGGVVPNTLDSEKLAPQDGIRVESNVVRKNSNPSVPAKDVSFPSFGGGVVVAGGTNNEVVDNLVRRHAYFGVAVVPMYDKNLWQPKDNAVRNNDVRNSGRADLALGLPSGGGNCFEDNDFGNSRPAAIEDRYGCDRSSILGSILGVVPGDLWPTLAMGRSALLTMFGNPPGKSYEEMPAPDLSRFDDLDDRLDVDLAGTLGTTPAEIVASMDDPEKPPRPPVGEAQ